MTVTHFAHPEQKSRADAARWVAHRFQQHAETDQILQELVDDGVDPDEARAVYREVRRSLRREGVPHGIRAVLLVAALVLVAVAAGRVWLWAKPPLPGTNPDPYNAYLMTDLFIAFVTGAAVAVVTAAVSGGRRSWRLTLLAVATDIVAFAWTSKFADPYGSGRILTVVGVAVSSLVSLWALTRTRPEWDISVESDGSFRWQRR